MSLLPADAIGNMAAPLGSPLRNQLSDEQQVGFPNNPAPNHWILVRGVWTQEAIAAAFSRIIGLASSIISRRSA
jgi:hypothetical protein